MDRVRSKTLWDWLDLLIIPLVLAIGEYLFTRTENRTAQAIAGKRAQDEALQSYIDQMSQLIIEYQLRSSGANDDVSVSARARTLTVLDRIDSNRKASLLRFLYEAGLINKEQPVVSLVDANLSEVNLFQPGHTLRRARLLNVGLAGADLRKADLRLAVLAGANLVDADLSETIAASAHLEQTNLAHATLFGARLVGAWLVESNMTGANMRHADLSQSNLRGAILANRSGEFNDTAELNDASLSRADLTNTDLTKASFVRANLTNANLTGAILQGANLKDSDLTGATVTEEQLATCASLEGTVMPNGLLSDGSVPDKPLEAQLAGRMFSQAII